MERYYNEREKEMEKYYNEKEKELKERKKKWKIILMKEKKN